MTHGADPVDDEEYNSASDEDFNPNNTAPVLENEDSSSSEDDDETARKPSKGSKRKVLAEDVDIDNSGDEATIKKVRRKKRKGSVEDDNVGGDGGLIKTRAQRRAEIQERKPLVNAGNSSVDVDMLWAQMATTKKPPEVSSEVEATQISQKVLPQEVETSPLKESSQAIPKSDATTGDQTSNVSTTSTINDTTPIPHADTGEATVTIKRTYKFAGETMTEERTVPASSAEARLYLSSQPQQPHKPTASATASTPASAAATKPPLRRPTKRASMFSVPPDAAKGSAGEGVGAQAAAAAFKGPKLTTLEKSKLDWAKHIDEEGISEELHEHRKAKEGYLGRMDFLGRMEIRKEEDIRKGMGRGK